MGNLHNVHDHPRFLALLRHLHIHTVWTPTDASWLNAIEAHFGVTKRATLTGSDDRDHVPSRRRIYRYLHYRNRRVDRQDHRPCGRRDSGGDLHFLASPGSIESVQESA
jgi:hypothetical protein